jgi:hypothetical protein
LGWGQKKWVQISAQTNWALHFQPSKNQMQRHSTLSAMSWK